VSWLVGLCDYSAETGAVSIVEKNPASNFLCHWTTEPEFVDPWEQ